MAPNERVVKAFSVMRSLGIPPQSVKPVLKKLLLLYDRNWQLIEEDNYRALADAIFEIQDNEKLNDKKAEMLGDEPEPSLKIPHAQDHKDQISSTTEDGSTALLLEEDENHKTLTPQVSIPRKRSMEFDPNSHQLLFIEKRKEPISSTMDPMETNSSSEGASCAFYSVPHFDVPSQYGSSNSINLLPQQPHIAFSYKRSIHVMSDITKGTEKVNIPLLDEIGNEHLPNFVYIAQNTVYQNAYVHVALAQIADEDCCPSCIGDCLSSSVPCACACDTEGEFAYTPQGLLKEEFLRACIAMNTKPQKQHLVYCQDCPLERAKNLNNVKAIY